MSSQNKIRILILLLSGSGSRFTSSIPKQYLPINKDGDTVFFTTANLFLQYDVVDFILFVPSLTYLSNSLFLDSYNRLKETYKHIYFCKTNGGETRHDSLIKAFYYLKHIFFNTKSTYTQIDWENSTLLIHDANRPFLTNSFIERIKHTIAEVSSENPCFIPTIPTPDSLLFANATNSYYLKRDEVFRVQTPQILHIQSFEEALQKRERSKNLILQWTDEGSFMYDMGYKVTPFKGDTANIKITYPGDL